MEQEVANRNRPLGGLAKIVRPIHRIPNSEVMRIDETRPLELETVLYRCSCGYDVQVDRISGGRCHQCGRPVSAKVLGNALAATMTIASPSQELEGVRSEPTGEQDPSELIGRSYGHFEIIKPLGRGGSGFVYQALDKSLQRYVAVKILKSGPPASKILDDESEVGLLMQEAVAQARVAHPNIVTIYYVGKEQNEPFLAMELIDGISLSERIEQGHISFGEISNVAEQITRALTFSYGMDIIHGDIKPSNILLPKTGGALLSDFGMARRVSEKSKLAKGGTPNYLAPELLNGASPSKQSDMYALGVTLYEMTFGRLPVELTGTSVVEWQNAHQNQAIEFPASWPENLPGDWQPCLKKLLAKEPENRFESYSELTAELRRLSPRSDVLAQPLPRIIATLIDWLIVILLMLPLRLAIDTDLVESSFWWRVLITFMDFIPIVSYTVLIFFWRQSVGRHLMQLRVINRFGMIPTGRKMVMRSVLRMIIPWIMATMMMFLFVEDAWRELVPVGFAVGVLAFVLADTGALLFSSNRKSLHDLIFETQVVIDS